MAGLEQQRDVGDRQRRAEQAAARTTRGSGDRRPGARSPRDRPARSGRQTRSSPAPRGRACRRRVATAAPNRCGDGGQSRRAGRDRQASETIGIDGRNAERGEPREAVRLSRRDAAGQRDLQHRRTSAARARAPSRGDGVLEQHRDRQRADAAGHRRERAAPPRRRPDARRRRPPIPAARNRRPAATSRRGAAAATARSATRFMPTSITVAPGLTNAGVTKPGPADRRHQDVGFGRDRGESMRSSSGRSSPWRRAAAAACAIGLPTMSLRPITTARAPAIGDAEAIEHLDHARTACRARDGRGPAPAGRR